ncbi:MAG: hypothetical protein ACOCYQ_05115 [Alkalispirochaeta sp.]
MKDTLRDFIARLHLYFGFYRIEVVILWAHHVTGFPRFREFVMHTSRWLFHVLPFLKNRTSSWPIVTALYQRMQFGVERMYMRRGRPRVEDPLAAFRFMFGPRDAKPSSTVAGRFQVYLKFNGINIRGYVKRQHESGDAAVDIVVEGRTIRSVNTAKRGGLHYFELNLKRDVVLRFPPTARISIRTNNGDHLAFLGRTGIGVHIPGAAGDLFQLLDEGYKITKKGQLTSSREEVIQRQNGYLELYSRMKEFFDNEIGTPVFLMYGTLLGLHRDGDFIPGDDDFDAGYIVDTTDPKEAKEETKRIITKLLYAGYTVSFNRRRKLFRVHNRKDGKDGIHLDLRPVWFSGGNMWAHLQACIPASVDDFLPVQTVSMRGVQVDIPRDPEVLLAGYYGPGWKVPDPGYVNDTASTRRDVVRTLDKARITPAEYRRMVSFFRNEGYQEGMGEFISLSYQSMYPLDQFIN